MKTLKLFRIQFDNQDTYIEAETMTAAIAIWHARARETDPQWDEPFTPEPDGCELVHDGPVLR